MPLLFTKAREWLTPGVRSDVFCVGLLLGLSIVIWLPRLEGPLDLRWDAGAYYILGSSLAEGQGYRLLNEPGQIEAIQYPPLLPAVGAAYQSILRSKDPHLVGHWLRVTFALLFAAYVVVVFLLLRQYLPAPYALCASLITLTSPVTAVISDFFLSDFPFALLMALFFLFQRMSSRGISQVLVPALALAAYALRTAGLALLAAWVMESILDKKIKQAVLRAALAALPVLGWQFHVSRVRSGPEFSSPAYEYQRADYMYYNVSYTQNIHLVDPFVPSKGYLTPVGLVERFAGNLRRMPRSVGEAVCARVDFWAVPFRSLGEKTLGARIASRIISLIPVGLGFLILGGIALQLIRRQWLIPLYVLFSLVMVFLTPFTSMFIRYTIPLTPFLALSLFEMVLWLRRKMEGYSPSRGRVVGHLFAGAVICSCLCQSPFYLYELYGSRHQTVSYVDRQGRSVQYRLFHYDKACQALDAGVDWLNVHARPGDVVAVSMPHWVFLRTGLTTVMPPFEPDPVRAETLLNSVPVDYVILDSTLGGGPADTTQYVRPVVHNVPDRWQRVYVAPQGGCEIYRRVG